eukprot:370929-Pyramimonas_sp.AAC.1
MTNIDGEDEEVDFDEDETNARQPAHDHAMTDPHQQGDLPAHHVPPTPVQHATPTPAQAMPATPPAGDRARRSRSHTRPRDDQHPQGRLP